MSEAIITVENLGKRYRLGAGRSSERYTALRDVIARRAAAPFRALGAKVGKWKSANGSGVPHLSTFEPSHTSLDEFWALKDVSFEVKHGEVVGIIGRNGAGKSTLLKILSRITEPTEGKVRIKGRVASLLEVGTGFHPELTGRENVYLNGAILGMSRTEIKAKFDEIVAFAEVEKFLDTPVKRYSSGMYVRLAFAVAAHLEPEILVIDEVLAVGDAEFQKKCLGKMDQIARGGRTVLFVSHQMGMITSLCDRAVLLEEGHVAMFAPTAETVRAYYTRAHASPACVDYTKTSFYVGDEYVQLLECYIKNADGEKTAELGIHQPVTIGLRCRVLREQSFTRAFTYPQLNLFSTGGELIFQSMAPSSQLGNLSPGEYTAECQLPANFLNNDTYYVGLGMASCENGNRVHFYENNVLCFQIKESLAETLYTTRNGFSGPVLGYIRPKLQWQFQRRENLQVLAFP